MVAAMMKNLLATLALVALVTTARAASVEVAPFGERGGQTVYALALAGDIKPADDRRVASLLGNALIEDRFPGFMMLSSNGGDTDASLGIARIAHEYGMPVLVRTKCNVAWSAFHCRVWRYRAAPGLGRRGLCERDPIPGSHPQGRSATAQDNLCDRCRACRDRRASARW
jgi:hypothetical protein